MTKCKYCGNDRALEGTKMCDACWEIAHRFYKIPSELLASIIVGETSRDFALELREEILLEVSRRFDYRDTF